MAYKGSGKKGRVQNQIGGGTRRSEIRIGGGGSSGGGKSKSKGQDSRKVHDSKGKNNHGRTKW